MLTTDDLAYLRASASDALPDDVLLSARTTTRDPAGGSVETWTPAAATVKGRLSDASPDAQQAYADRLAGNDGYTLTLPWGTVVNYGDHAQVNGHTYAVVARIDMDTWATVQRVICRRVR